MSSLLGFLGQLGDSLGIGDASQPNALTRLNNAADPQAAAQRQAAAGQIGLMNSAAQLPPPSANDPAAMALYAGVKSDPEKFLPLYASHIQEMQTNPLTMMSYGSGGNIPSPIAPAVPTAQTTQTSNLSQAADVIAPANDGKNYDYLNTNVPPAFRNIVKGMVEGQDVPITLRGDPKLGGALKIWASNFDPSFSDSTYEARNKTLKDFSSGGKEANSIIAGQTALSHLGNFVNNVNSQGNSAIQPLNWLGSLVGSATGDPNVLRAHGDKATLASELATFYKGGTPTDSGTDEMMNILSTNQGKTGTDAMANEVGTLMKGKIKSLRDQYDASMGAGASNKRNIFSKEALDTLDKLGVDTSDIIQPNHPAKNTPNTPSAPAQPSAPEATKVIGGVTYVQKNGKWFQQ